MLSPHVLSGREVGREPERTSRPGGEDEDQDARRCVEALHQGLALLGLCGAIQAQVGESMQVEPDLQHVQHARHLRKNQRPAAPRPQPSQQPVQLLCETTQSTLGHDPDEMESSCQRQCKIGHQEGSRTGVMTS